VIDVFLNVFHSRVKEGYFFTYVFTGGFQIFADFTILVIICRMGHYLFPRLGAKPLEVKIWRIMSEAFLLVLAALALYWFALHAAHLILSLNAMPASVVDKVHEQEVKISSGFQMLYLVVSVLLLTNGLMLLGKKLGQKPTAVSVTLISSELDKTLTDPTLSWNCSS